MTHAADLPSLAEQWASFARIAVPPGASIEQRTSMRNCFYAGATVILKTSLKIGEIENEHEAVALLDRYHEEIEIYAALIVAKNQGDLQ